MCVPRRLWERHTGLAVSSHPQILTLNGVTLSPNHSFSSTNIHLHAHPNHSSHSSEISLSHSNFDQPLTPALPLGFGKGQPHAVIDTPLGAGYASPPPEIKAETDHHHHHHTLPSHHPASYPDPSNGLKAGQRWTRHQVQVTIFMYFFYLFNKVIHTKYTYEVHLFGGHGHDGPAQKQ